MNNATLSLVLPAYNEEANLAPVVHMCLGVLRDHFADFEIIIVDDGSSDTTSRIADQLATVHDPVVVLHHRRNRGYGAALIHGFGAARGDYFMVMDADRQFSVSDIARCAPYLDRYDVIAGYRLHRHDGRYSQLTDTTFNRFVTRLFGLKLRDVNCGFKLFRADLIRDMQLASSGPMIHAELYAKAARAGASLVEVGVNHYPRAAGRARIATPRTLLRTLAEAGRLWWRLRSYVPSSSSTGRPRMPWQRKAWIGGALAAALGGAWTVLRRR